MAAERDDRRSTPRGAADESLARLRENAFYVLELPVTASRHDVERQGQKLLGMLQLGLSAAARYPTPVGPAARDEDLVRVALARLRDPDKRLEEELWARLPARPVPSAADGAPRVEETPAASSPVEETPAEETPAADSPVEETPAADFTVEDPFIDDLPRAPMAPRADRPWPDALVALGWGRR